MAPHTQAAALTFVQRLAKDLEDKRLVLPAFPNAVTRIQLALQSDDNSIGDIVQILGSEPALAVRLLQIANAWAIRRAGPEVTDLHQAVKRMGYDMVRSIAIAFGMRRLQGDANYSPAGQAELKAALTEAVQVAAISYVLAKHFTRLKPGEALLTGLLHAIGRLYIIKRFEEADHVSDEELQTTVAEWHPTIGKAIAESWGLPEALGTAIEQQNDYEINCRGPVSLSEVLIAARLTNRGTSPEAGAEPDTDEEQQAAPVFDRLGIPRNDESGAVDLSTHIEEIGGIRSALTR